MSKVEYLSDRASGAQIADHLSGCDADFVPPLSARVDIEHYATKLTSNATRFEAWSNGILVGLVAAYFNDSEKRIVYVTSVSVLRNWKGKGIGARLLGQCIDHAKASGMRQVSLEVASDNVPAIKLYERCGFLTSAAKPPFVCMNLVL
jgi:ribosomal protein S18 acetylase RimI-like enzyme